MEFSLGRSLCRRLYSRTVDEWASRCDVSRFPVYVSPTMHVHAVVMHSDVFRKVHVEYARLASLEIVRCVAFPYPQYEVPVLDFDVVVVDRTDVRRAHTDLSFPGYSFDYWDGIHASIRTKHPARGDDVYAFSDYAVDLVRKYHNDAGLFETSHDYAACHAAYCAERLKNDAVQKLLAASFSPEFADEYTRSIYM